MKLSRKICIPANNPILSHDTANARSGLPGRMRPPRTAQASAATDTIPFVIISEYTAPRSPYLPIRIKSPIPARTNLDTVSTTMVLYASFMVKSRMQKVPVKRTTICIHMPTYESAFSPDFLQRKHQNTLLIVLFA